MFILVRVDLGELGRVSESHDPGERGLESRECLVAELDKVCRRCWSTVDSEALAGWVGGVGLDDGVSTTVAALHGVGEGSEEVREWGLGQGVEGMLSGVAEEAVDESGVVID